MRLLPRFLVALAMTAPFPSGAAPAAPAARELGWVRWGDDLDAALARSRASGRPVLILFQEIPGCATCVGFGEGPLSNPLLIEAIESEFEPVAVRNNRPGRDAAILARFGEPAWNNPVMRVVDAAGRDVVPRRDGLWTSHQVAARLAEALEAAGRPVPGYLRWALEETDLARHERATFAMHCFWEGEARFGALDGVVATRAGFLDGREVVEVTWHRDRLDYATLLERAEEMRCAARVVAHTGDQFRRARARVGERAARADAPATSAPPADRTRHLNGTRWAALPLTPMQATRVNAALARGEDPERWLSPGQRALAARLAARLAANPQALAGFARPEDPGELGAYRWRLAAALGAGGPNPGR